MREVTVALLFTFGLLGSQSYAQSFSCSLKKNGYSHALLSAAGNIAEQQKIINSWIPESFKVSPQTLTFTGRNGIPVTGGDREKSFKARFGKKRYEININPYENSGTVTMLQNGYKRMGPVRFSCEAANASNVSSNKNNLSRYQAEFQKLSFCNRKYVQQFLKGQGFYNGGIDGKWGRGTASGMARAMKLNSFKNLSVVQVFRKLQDNPLC
jgi:hypothetical protein